MEETNETIARLERRCKWWRNLEIKGHFSYSIPEHRSDLRKLRDLKAMLAVEKSRF